jgi:hypothetical protein
MAFRRVWTVLNLSTVSEAEIRGWISAAQIPSCFQFVFESPFENLWYIGDWYGGHMPMPVTPWTIAISSWDDPRFTWTVYGLSVGDPANTCTIAFQPSNANDTPAEIGARMWHEISHSMGLPADDMKTGEFSGFSQYLIDTGSSYQDFISNPSLYDLQSPWHTAILIEFYTYLTKKYLSASGCYGTSPPPVTTPCQGMYRDGVFSISCILENPLYLGAAGVAIAALFLLIR